MCFIHFFMKKAIVLSWIVFFFSFSSVMGQKAVKKNPTTAEIYNLFQNPPMQYRPMVRWWWNGDKVETGELVRELHVLKDAGIGGVEINAIEFPTHGDPDMGIPSLPWLSDAWIDALKVALDTAQSLGMTTDLLVGSGWPYGGEYLSEKERAQLVVNYTKKLKGPMYLEISKDALFALSDPKISSAFIGRKMELMRLILVKTPCSDVSDCIDLTSREQNGSFHYRLPEGNYTLSALVKVNGFLKVIDGALGADGPVLDHYNASAVLRYLQRMSSAIEKRIGALRRYLRAFFTDSMELEGANWSDDMEAEFKARRGYEVSPYLPFFLHMTGKMGDPVSYDSPIEVTDSLSEILERVRYDFETTKAELMCERFLDVYRTWADSLGIKARAQAYGRGFFPLESSMHVDIPEGESWTTNFLKHRPGEEMSEADYRRGRAYTMIDKYVSSAAHLNGVQQISCEEMTNTYRVFNMTLQELKLGGDQTIASGITHSIFHGFNYMPSDAPFPGWIRYGAYYNENNTWWPYFHLYNEYKARLYSVLQNCENYADIAILTPTADMWGKMGMQNEPFPSTIHAPYQTLVWEAIVKNGGACDYVSEGILKASTMEKGNICYGNRKYNTLFLINVESISSEVASQLQRFVASGGRVICIETVPFRSLGLHADNAAEDQKVSDCMRNIREQYPKQFLFIHKPDTDFVAWYAHLQAEQQLPHAMNIETPNPYLMQVHYVTSDGNDVFFISNSHRYNSCRTKFSFLPSIGKGKSLYLWNPETGQKQLFVSDTLDMGPATSLLLVFEKKNAKVKDTYRSFDEQVSGLHCEELKSVWNVTMDHVRTHQIKEMQMPILKDLSKIALCRDFAGQVSYRQHFQWNGKGGAVYLDLGVVEGISSCLVNGQEVGLKWYGKHAYVLPSSFLKNGDNELEIKVVTVLGNYMKSLLGNPVAQYWTNKDYKVQPWQPMGLLGPVKIYFEN